MAAASKSRPGGCDVESTKANNEGPGKTRSLAGPFPFLALAFNRRPWMGPCPRIPITPDFAPVSSCRLQQ